MSVAIAAFDPGATTGIAILEEGMVNYRSFEVNPEKYPHPHETFFDVISALEPREIVYEAFNFRQGQYGAVFTGVEYIGVIKLYSQLKCIEEISMTSSEGKAFWNDNKLRALGLYKPGHPHANDAIRILLKHRMNSDPEWKAKILSELHNVLT